MVRYSLSIKNGPRELYSHLPNGRGRPGLCNVNCCTRIYMREILRAEPEGISESSGYISPYITTQVKIQTLSISKYETSSILFPGRSILEELILCIALAAGTILSHMGFHLGFGSFSLSF